MIFVIYTIDKPLLRSFVPHRIAEFMSGVDESVCRTCCGSWRMPLYRFNKSVLPCCWREAHVTYINRAVQDHQQCPGCDFPLSIQGFINLAKVVYGVEGRHLHAHGNSYYQYFNDWPACIAIWTIKGLYSIIISRCCESSNKE